MEEAFVNGLTIKAASLCVMTTLVCSCVTRTSLRHGAASVKHVYEPVKPSSLSEYMRAIYKLSSESANKSAEERAALLTRLPELAELVKRVEKNSDDVQARSELVSAYMDHQMFWAAYELVTNAQAAGASDSDISLALARIWDVWGQY